MLWNNFKSVSVKRPLAIPDWFVTTIIGIFFSNISLIGHSTGGGSAHLYCSRNNCNSLILQDPFFVPLLEEVGTIDLVTDSYFIYSEYWYNGYEDINDLNEIIGFIDQLNEVDTDNVKPLSSVTGHALPLRDDKVCDGNINQDILRNAPEQKSGYFVVPKVIEWDERITKL